MRKTRCDPGTSQWRGGHGLGLSVRGGSSAAAERQFHMADHRVDDPEVLPAKDEILSAVSPNLLLPRLRLSGTGGLSYRHGVGGCFGISVGVVFERCVICDGLFLFL